MDVERESFSCAVYGKNVCFSFMEQSVLNNIDFNIDQGKIYGLLGPSGCGKTTLLKCIIGNHQPTKGTIKIYGRVPGQKGFCIPGRGVGFMPQELALYPEITTEETLMYFGRLYQISYPEIRERIKFLVDLLEIPDKNKVMKKLSCGQQRRVSFAACLIHKPPLLILDEPTVGVDPLLRKNIWKHLQNLATKDNVTIIITTHYVEEARQAHMVGLMRKGQLLAETNPERLIRQHNVSNLEDVFLKLCDESESHKTNADSKPHLEIVPHSDNKKVPDAVWVPYNDLGVKYELHINNATGEKYYKVALLYEDLEVLEDDNSCSKQLQTTFAHIAALMWKNFLCLRRNIPLFFTQILVPALTALTFCLCMGGELFNLNVAVVNTDTESSGYGQKFLNHVDDYYIIQKPYLNVSLAIDSVKQGKTHGVVYIGPHFSDSLVERFLLGPDVDNKSIEESRISLYLDSTNQQISSTVYTHLMKGFQNFSESMLLDMQMNTLLASPPLIMGDPIYGKKQPSFTEFSVPGMVLSVTFLSALGLSILSIIVEKKEGLLDRCKIAGVSSSEVIFSNLFALFFVMIAQSSLVMILTLVVFNIPCHGNIIWIVIATLLVGMEGMSIGILISCVSSDENTAIMAAIGSYFPTVLLSGIVWSAEAMPFYLQYMGYGLPLTLIINTVRSVLLRGWGILDNNIWDGFLVALAWIIIPIVISSFIFKLKK